MYDSACEVSGLPSDAWSAGILVPVPSSAPIVPGSVIGVLAGAAPAQVYDTSADGADGHLRRIRASLDASVFLVESAVQRVVSLADEYSLSYTAARSLPVG